MLREESLFEIDRPHRGLCGFCFCLRERKMEETNMKKILTLILALTMLFALAACGQSAAPKTFTVGICQFV